MRGVRPMAGNSPGSVPLQETPQSGPIGQTVGAASDLVRNWLEMKALNTKGVDQYYHCKGNCEAASRGPIAKAVSSYLSGLREGGQLLTRQDRLWEVRPDLYANDRGLRAPSETGFETCTKSCEPLWPRNVPKR